MMKNLYLQILCCAIVASLAMVSTPCSAQGQAGGYDYQGYQSTIYEPFTSSVPSDQSEVGSSYTSNGDEGSSSSANRANARRLGGQDVDPNGPGPGSPIGDPTWPMLVFVLIAAGVICMRRIYSFGEKKSEIEEK